MAVLTEKMLVIKAEKVPEFTAIMKKPMISKAFLETCKKSAQLIPLAGAILCKCYKHYRSRLPVI